VASEATNIIQRGQTAFIVKWIASVIQILGYAGTAFGWTPWNLYLFLIGVLGWLIVGVIWNDKAIMLIHFVALGSMLAGMASQ
jgi:TM2 domain-containing membrane protein YozV